MLIDLDDLKTVNDHFGHSFGDDLIVAASGDISRTAGNNAFVSRVGGDEFIVILPRMEDLRSIAQFVDKLLKTLHREYTIRGQQIPMSSSVGVALYPSDGDAVEELLKNADVAMYAAKFAGKNCWRYFDPGMHKDNYEKMILTNSLRYAMDAEELYLEFQPLVAMPGRTVIGFEALLRWHSKTHGFIGPDRFIPLAESKGMIVSIGYWVIEKACRFVRRLSELGFDRLKVAVNISPRQLEATDLVESIETIVADAGISPNQLELEVTENILIESATDVSNKLERLSNLGIGLSLDDFGTGFSSLTYLRTLPVSKLKIDKSFIEGIAEDPIQAGLARSIIEMAHLLDIDVVAEGVETEAQLGILTQFGCDCVQGYVFSRPVSDENAIRCLGKASEWLG